MRLISSYRNRSARNRMTPYTERVIEFQGLNRLPVINDGEMRDMYNMSDDEYPCLTQRKPRGTYTENSTEWLIDSPKAMIAKSRIESGNIVDHLGVINYDSGSWTFKYNGVAYSGLGLSAKTQMVAINSKICFFPEKKWFDVQTLEYGSLDASVIVPSNGYMTITSDGTYQNLTLSDYASDTNSSGDITGGQSFTFVLTDTPATGSNIILRARRKLVGTDEYTYKQITFRQGEAARSGHASIRDGSISYDGDKTFVHEMGDELSGSYAKITEVRYFKSSIMSGDFKVGDVIDIYGDLSVDEEHFDYSETPCTCRVEAFDGTTISIPDQTFIELDAAGVTTANMFDASIKRESPNLDYVMEYNNRLWGVDNSTNEIRASKLGDPTNWNYFQGESIDSYAATQGTDGEFTGLAAYPTHLIFFKEDYMHKVYGSAPATYQIETAKCFGVEKGSSKSVQCINDTLIYKSREGFMAYEGGSPMLISEKFGDLLKCKNVKAGTDGKKYYACAQAEITDVQDSIPITIYTYKNFVFDIVTGLWHIEDDTQMDDFCFFKGKLLMIPNTTPPSNGIIKYANADSGETDMAWYAEFGEFDEFIENHKIYSRLRMRLRMSTGSTLIVKMKIDDGSWETIESLAAPTSDKALSIPVVPRRCEKYAIRLQGTGKVRIESLTRRYRTGTDRRDISS